MSDKRDSKSGKWKQGNFFLDETRRSQQKTALRIRKGRNADRLREKRGQTLALDEHEILKGQSVAALQGIASGVPTAEILLNTHRLLSINSDVTAKALQHLLELDEGATARKLLTHLSQPPLAEASLPVLHEMSLSLATSKLPIRDDDYYGRAPLQWKNLFFPEEGSPTIVSAILQYPPSKIGFDTIGNIVQYSPDAALPCIIPQHWGSVAGALHNGASYAVAAILRADMVHFGMDLIQAMDRPFDEAILQTTDGLWILQGLSRREQQCVDMLRNTPSVRQSLLFAITSTSEAKILVPALQTLTNLEIPCDDVLRHVPSLIDAVPAAVVCTANEKWIPLFVEMLVEGSISYAWKVEIVHALADFREITVESFWRDELIDPLVGLMKLHDTVGPAVAVLDRALRCIDGRLRVPFEAAGGVELLEEHAAHGLRMAELLVDDFFADEEEFDEVATAFDPPPTSSLGRGRGRPIPAWMDTKQ